MRNHWKLRVKSKIFFLNQERSFHLDNKCILNKLNLILNGVFLLPDNFYFFFSICIRRIKTKLILIIRSNFWFFFSTIFSLKSWLLMIHSNKLLSLTNYINVSMHCTSNTSLCVHHTVQSYFTGTYDTKFLTSEIFFCHSSNI